MLHVVLFLAKCTHFLRLTILKNVLVYKYHIEYYGISFVLKTEIETIHIGYKIKIEFSYGC